MERELIGTVGIAVVSSMVLAVFLLGPGNQGRVSVLEMQYPATLTVAASDSVGENAFALAFTCLRPQARVVVEYAFLYRQDLQDGGLDQANGVADAVEAMDRIVPAEFARTWSGTTTYNGSEAEYGYYDYRRYAQTSGADRECVFLLITEGNEVVATFSGVPDVFPERERGSLIDAMVTRSGNRTYYSRRSLEQAGSIPIQELPSGEFLFEDLEADETIEVSFRSDAFFTKTDSRGAAQVISITCDDSLESFMLNFMG